VVVAREMLGFIVVVCFSSLLRWWFCFGVFKNRDSREGRLIARGAEHRLVSEEIATTMVLRFADLFSSFRSSEFPRPLPNLKKGRPL